MEIDRIIALVSLLIGVFGIIYPVWNQITTRKKKIDINREETYPIINDQLASTFPELSITWNKKELNSAFLVQLFFRNSGNSDLGKGDFITPISIQFDEEINILNSKLFTSSEYSKLKWSELARNIIIIPEIFEKKKLIKVECLYEHNKVSPLNVEIQLLNGTKKKKDIKATKSEYLSFDYSTKLYSIGAYYIPIFILLIVGFSGVNGIIKFLEFYFVGLEISSMTKSIMMISMLIIVLATNLAIYSKQMAFRDVRTWVEHEKCC